MVTTATANAPALHADDDEYAGLPEAFRVEADDGDSIIWVPIAKTGRLVPINVTKCSEASYTEALWLGMKLLANRGTTKVTLQACDNDEAKLATARLEKAAEQLTKIMDGTVRMHTGATKKVKVPANVMAEAKKIARADLEDQIRANGMNPHHYPAKMMTAATLRHLDQRPEIMRMAEENVKRRQEMPKVAFDLSTLVPDATKVEASKARKAKAKAKEDDVAARTLPTRQRPAPAQHAPH